MMLPELVAIWWPSGGEWIVILVVALLLFGKRLPEVARSLGKGIVEFKTGIKGIEDEVDRQEYEPPKRYEAPKQAPTGQEPPAQGTQPSNPDAPKA